MKICPHCKKEFDEGYAKKQKYCSRACRNSVYTIKGYKFPERYTGICKICGKEFKAAFRNKKYCSSVCRNKYYTLHRYGGRPERARARGTAKWRNRRQEILEKQDKKCWLCNGAIEGIFEIHHLVGPSDSHPISEDVAAFHRKCHNRIHHLSLCTDGKVFWVEGQALEELKAQGRVIMKDKYIIGKGD